ncbi:cation:proton antiporter [Aequorivita capsosiphonis]|uniref:cation:proton antiporter n=1 Tax=Aequorivita capsosiphonis TaxID=487317 RepID=UPI000478A9DE|nr:sodium:proton antiporter [Aequorivita capsosiphonis]
MNLFHLISILIVFAATFGYLNERFLKLPAIIGLFLISMAFSLLVLLLGNVFPSLLSYEKSILNQIDFQNFLMKGILGLMLFAGALRLDLEQMKTQRIPIFIFATLGVLISTFIIGIALFNILGLMGISVPLIHTLIFGALISPTDPIAILGILNKTSIAKSLEIKIEGESLFNDGVGYVLFVTLCHIATQKIGDAQLSFFPIALLFLKEVGGALILGYLLGKLTTHALSKINNYEVEVLLTLALVMGGYMLADILRVSGPIAMVVGGLMIGKGLTKGKGLSDITKDYVRKFWELIDALLNAILFLLLGLTVLQVQFNKEIFIIGIFCILLVLLSRFISLKVLTLTMKNWIFFEPGASFIMTWGGLRGGISIAMAIILSQEISKDLFLSITYIIVVFSILVQGLTLEKVVKKFDANVEKETKRKIK